MSQEHVEVVRQGNAALNRRDAEAILALCADDIEVEDLRNAPDLPRIARGKDGVRELLTGWLDTFDDFSAEIEEYIDVDDRHVACSIRYVGSQHGSGLEVDAKQVDVWELRGNKLVRGTMGYADRESALQALAGAGSG